METNAVLKAQAMGLMLAGYTQKTIAEELNVSTRTLRRWAREPEFVNELKEERDGLLAIARTQAIARAQIEVEEGIASTRFIAAVRENERAPIEIRMRAAGTLMNHSFKVTTFFMKHEDTRAARTDKAEGGMQTAGGNKQAAATDDTAIRNSPDEVAKAANSGQNRTHADAPESAIQNPQPAIAEAAKSGQNRTHDDTLAQFAIRNPQSAMEADETTVLRKRALDASEAHIKRINEMEKKALHQAKENNADPGKIAEMRDNFERARQAIDETMEAIDIASLEELRQVCNDPKNPFFDLAMPKSA